MEYGEKRLLEYINGETYIELSKEENITRDDLNKWCKELGIDELNNDKSTLNYIEHLQSKGINFIDFYNRFKHKAYGIHPSRFSNNKHKAYGIHPSRFSNKFKVNNYQRRKMIKIRHINAEYVKIIIYSKIIICVPGGHQVRRI